MEQLLCLAVHAVGQLMQLLGVMAIVAQHIRQQRQCLLRRVGIVGVRVFVVMAMAVLVFVLAHRRTSCSKLALSYHGAEEKSIHFRLLQI